MSFDAQLREYKRRIDADIESYISHMNTGVLSTYGEHSADVSNTYTDVLKQNSDRLRGTLTIVGYEMCRGTDQDMIIKAARAIEMMHASTVIIDEIQSQSDASTQKLLNAALFGSQSASLVLGMLDVPEELRIKALNIMNHTMNVTTHGRINAVELSADASDAMADNVRQWKTSHNTFLNPIHMGMVLAGAPCEDTNAITQYALHAGKAFQYHPKSDTVDHAQKTAKQYISSARESLHEHANRWNPQSVEFLGDLTEGLSR